MAEQGTPRRGKETDPVRALALQLNAVRKAVAVLSKSATLRNASISGGEGLRVTGTAVTIHNDDDVEVARYGLLEHTTPGGYGLEVLVDGEWVRSGAFATEDASGVMSAADKALLSGATHLATGGTLALRHSSGSIQVVTGTSASDAASKGYVDIETAKRAPVAHRHPWADLDNVPATFAPVIGSTATTAKAGNWFPTWTEVTSKPTTFTPSAHNHPFTDITGTATPAQLPAATPTAAGSLSAADKTKLDAATFSNTGGTLALRHSSGSIQVTTGTNALDAANKGYVDAAVAADHTFPKLRLTATGDASATSTGHAFQIGPDAGLNMVIDQNEILSRNNGVANETLFSAGATSGVAPVGVASLTRRDYVDDQIAAATADIGAATATVVVGTLARRSASDGGIQFFRVVSTDTGTPAANHLIRKDWVDSQLAKAGLFRSAGTVAVPVLAAGATTTVSITFPAARFTVAPIMNFDSGDGRVTVGSKAVTATGATITLCNYTAAASAAATGQWQAVQMTASAAAG